MNPVSEMSQLYDQAVPFDKIKNEHFIPAIEIGIAKAKENIEKIKNNPEAPTFANTIEALETASEQLEYASGIYFNLYSAEANEELQALAKEISPKMAAYSSDISLDEKLFQKIKSVYDQQKQFNLNAEQTRLLEKYYKDFARNGALLDAARKERLRTIDQELSVLSPQFSENVLKATNAFELIIDNKADLAGLPEGAIEAAAAAAEQKDQHGKWLFNLQYPSYLPFMKYADNRALREKIWRAFGSKAFNDSFDNQQVVLKTVTLRHERAQLLGFRNHAEFVLQERMAQTPEQVMNFLNGMFAPVRKAADRDLAELKQFKKTITGDDSIEPWDILYFSEKLQQQKYSYSDEDLRPYFRLENVIEGVFEHARKLYGLKFKPTYDAPGYHPDVHAYEVTDEKTGEYVCLFYADFFPRETKKNGAWMTSYRDQGLMFNQVRRPHISIVCNFTKPTPTKPSLLTFDEVRTLFHEFGHALHGMLSKCHYRSLSGTNVYWDFVELPSQIMENWALEKAGLDLFARHYQTGEAIPAELVEKIRASSQFQAGLMALRQLSLGYLDMAWHTTEPSKIGRVADFEAQATTSTQLLPRVPGVNVSCGFSHIFAGGYSSGYYSYKWAEVLDADAFEFFKEKGVFNAEVAQKFKEHILSRGGTEHPMELYKKFRGREPDPNALLRREGLI